MSKAKTYFANKEPEDVGNLEVDSLSLNGVDLKTTLDNLQDQINSLQNQINSLS
jgi:hypothetical protein